jgi:iron(III) transport system ATP-binding protein
VSTISLRNLSKSYVKKDGRRAVNGISVEVADGEVLALVGPSGCGKTTTLQLLAGFLRPDDGEIWVGDRLVSSASGVVPPERRHMSLVFQSYAVWPHKTVFENVAFGLQVRRASRADIETRVSRMLDIVKLKEFAQRYPSELSGGQQQRVALARAIAIEPEILLLDEPLSNLDANLREEMRFEIRRLHDQIGITTVYVTHDQDEAMVTADRIAVLNLGEIEQLGTPEDIYERPRTAMVASFIGKTNRLPGTLLERGVVDLGGVTMRAADESGLPAGAGVFLCVRPHCVSFSASNGVAANGPEINGAAYNTCDGTIVRQTYLGDSRDYLVELANGERFRAVGDPAERFDVGARITLSMRVDACRVVPA